MGCRWLRALFLHIPTEICVINRQTNCLIPGEERLDKHRPSLCCKAGGTASQLQYHILHLKCQSHVQKQAQRRKGTGLIRKVHLTRLEEQLSHKTEGITPQRTAGTSCRGTAAAIRGTLLGPAPTSACASPRPALPSSFVTRRPLPKGNRFSPALSEALHQESDIIAQSDHKKKSFTRYISRRQLPCASSAGTLKYCTQASRVGSFSTSDESLPNCWRFFRKG